MARPEGPAIRRASSAGRKPQPAPAWADAVVRFVLGGAAVAATYLAVQLLPWPAVAGILSAFPAVMASAVSLTGWRDGDEQAAQVAQGAITGMLGGVVAVAVSWFALAQGLALSWSITAGLSAWLPASWGALLLRRRWVSNVAHPATASLVSEPGGVSGEEGLVVGERGGECTNGARARRPSEDQAT